MSRLTENENQKEGPQAGDDLLNLGAPVELIVLAVRDTTARCRVADTAQEITFRSGEAWKLVPGEIATVQGRKQWRHRGYPYLSGEVVGVRLSVDALGLTPLRLQDEWPWDPAEECWGEEDEPLEAWARPIIARGVRPSYEMEQVLPGRDPVKWVDPIVNAAELYNAGDWPGARKKLMDELAADLRCLDAHAHLGLFTFDRSVEESLRHYEVGVRIGELSLGQGFEGLLPWTRIDNRPFLRCLHGYGLCLWRLGRAQEAQGVFERMLWLNPSDNQGMRFLLPQLRVGEAWEERYAEV